MDSGDFFTAGELRSEIDAEVLFVFVANYGLAVIMFGLVFWAARSPLPATVTGLCLYLAVHVLNAIFDPTTLFQGLIWKVVIISVFVGGIKAAVSEKAASHGEDMGFKRRVRARRQTA